jgi:hypothetical protein
VEQEEILESVGTCIGGLEVEIPTWSTVIANVRDLKWSDSLGDNPALLKLPGSLVYLVRCYGRIDGFQDRKGTF